METLIPLPPRCDKVRLASQIISTLSYHTCLAGAETVSGAAAAVAAAAASPSARQSWDHNGSPASTHHHSVE